jgi:hypothetical protein
LVHGPAFAGADARRHDALNRAVDAVQWLIAKVIAAVDDNESPTAGG